MSWWVNKGPYAMLCYSPMCLATQLMFHLWEVAKVDPNMIDLNRCVLWCCLPIKKPRWLPIPSDLILFKGTSTGDHDVHSYMYVYSIYITSCFSSCTLPPRSSICVFTWEYPQVWLTRVHDASIHDTAWESRGLLHLRINDQRRLQRREWFTSPVETCWVSHV